MQADWIAMEFYSQDEEKSFYIFPFDNDKCEALVGRGLNSDNQ
jgi:hypothetical protein